MVTTDFIFPLTMHFVTVNPLENSYFFIRPEVGVLEKLWDLWVNRTINTTTGTMLADAKLYYRCHAFG
jgi:hypothetical protein